jgi:hypothetical protein
LAPSPPPNGVACDQRLAHRATAHGGPTRCFPRGTSGTRTPELSPPRARGVRVSWLVTPGKDDLRAHRPDGSGQPQSQTKRVRARPLRRRLGCWPSPLPEPRSAPPGKSTAVAGVGIRSSQMRTTSRACRGEPGQAIRVSPPDRPACGRAVARAQWPSPRARRSSRLGRSWSRAGCLQVQHACGRRA